MIEESHTTWWSKVDLNVPAARVLHIQNQLYVFEVVDFIVLPWAATGGDADFHFSTILNISIII